MNRPIFDFGIDKPSGVCYHMLNDGSLFLFSSLMKSILRPLFFLTVMKSISYKF